MAKLEKFIPKEEEQDVQILQAPIDRQLWEKLDALRHRLKLTWPEMLTAMSKLALEDDRPRRKHG